MLYFAYGQDLNSHSVLDFCRARRMPIPRRGEPRRAILSNHRIHFANHDPLWNGGVADIVVENGKSVSGALMDISQRGLETLSVMAGGRARQTVRVTPWRGGPTVEAIAFFDGRSDSPHIPPTQLYLDRLIDSAVHLGLSMMWIMQLKTFAVQAIPAMGLRSPLRSELDHRRPTSPPPRLVPDRIPPLVRPSINRPPRQTVLV